jgi:hypothetical protein
MTLQYSRLIFLFFSILSIGTVSAEDLLPASSTKDVIRLSVVSVGNLDFYVPLSFSYPIKSAGQKTGPNQLWFKAIWIPNGQSMATWNEQQSFLVLPPKAPPIEVVSAQLSKMCPKSFFKENVDPPQFTNAQKTVSAAIMGCKTTSEHPDLELRGYYVAIHNNNHNYLLSRENRGDPAQNAEAFTSEALDALRNTFSKFAVCPKGQMCAKLQ